MNSEKAIESTAAEGNQQGIDRFSVGDAAWIPASLTQLLFTPPPEYNVSSFGGKLAYLPVILKSIEGESATFGLEWSSAVNIKCKQDEAMKRIVDIPLDQIQLSKIPIINEATLTDYIWSRYRIGELSCYCGPVPLLINPLQNTGPSARSSYTHNAELCILHADSLSAASGAPNLTSIAGTMIRTLKETCFPQTFVPRGQCGSGKSEACKEVLQMVIFADSTRKDFSENRPLPHYEALGSPRNAFYCPSDSTIADNIAAAVAVIDAFCTAPTERSPLSTRFVTVCRVNYHMGDALVSKASSAGQATAPETSLAVGAVAGIDYFAVPMEPYHVGFKDSHCRPYSIFLMLASMLADSGLHHINATMRDLVLSDVSQLSPEQLQQQFAHLTALIESSGMPVEMWESCVAALCACLHLQQLTLVGADTAIISAGTKNSAPYCEEALGVEIGSISDFILKKTEEKMGRAVVTDHKLADARLVVDGLVAEIYRRVMDQLLIGLSEASFAKVAQRVGLETAAKLTGLVPLNIVDCPGWETVDGNACNGYSQLMSNYIEERVSTQFSEHVFLREIRKLEEESIVMPSVVVPDNSPLVELFEKPVSGIISLLDETCHFPRGDDKTFAEKTISTHVKTKLVRSGGSKAKQVTAFVVKHSFGEVVYDAVNFVHLSKVRLAANIVSFLSASPLLCLSHSPAGQPCRLGSMDIMDKVVARGPAAAPSAGAAESSKSPGRAAGAGIGSKVASTFARSKESLNKLLKAVDDTSAVTHVLCVRPHGDGCSRVLNPDYVARQLKHLNVVELARFRRLGYSYSSKYSECFGRFRIIAPFFHGKLPSSLPFTTTRKDTELLTKLLLTIIFDEMKLSRSSTMASWSMDQAIASGDLVFGLTRIFMREDLVDAIEALRREKNIRVVQAAKLLQSICRMALLHSRFLTLKRGALALQSLQRMRSNRSHFLAMKSSSNLVKATFRMHRQFAAFGRLKNAVGTIKTRLLTGMLHRIRFVRLQKSLRVAQSLARSFIIRNMAARVNHAVTVLHIAGKDFIRRLRLFYLRKHAATTMQRVFRGWCFRESNAALAYALKVRRNQRIVKCVVRKLQARWRGKLVRHRFRIVCGATMCLQRWARSRLQRFWFLAVQTVTNFLQRQARRLLSVARVDAIRLTALMKEEREALRQTRAKELSMIMAPPTGAKLDVVGCRPIDLVVGNGAIKNNLASEMFTRRIIGLDIASSSHTEAYPEPYTWMQTVVDFASHLKADNKKSLAMLAVGTTHTLCVDDKFDVYSFGLGDSGQLGHNNRKNVFKAPCKIAAMSQTVAVAEAAFQKSTAIGAKLVREAGFLMKVLSVCCGKDFSLLLLGSRRVYSWGSNKRGQLGHSAFIACPLPKALESLHNRNIKAISCGSFHCAAINEQGWLYTWGAGYGLGRIRDEVLRGDGSSARAASHPTSGSDEAWLQEDCCEMKPLPFFVHRKVKAVACGEQHTMARGATELLSWGINSNGQLGDGSSTNRHLPVAIKLPISIKESDIEYSSLVAAGKHSGILLKSKVFMWGNNKFGQLGLGHTNDAWTPQRVILPNVDNQPVKQLVTGYQCSLALTADLRLFGWGTACFIPTYHDLVDAVDGTSSSLSSAMTRLYDSAGGISMKITDSPRQMPVAWGKSAFGATPSQIQPTMLLAPTQLIVSSQVYGYIHEVHIYSSSSLTVIAVDSVLPVGPQPTTTNSMKYESQRKVDPFAPQNVIEARRADGILQVAKQAEIQAKFKEAFHGGARSSRSGHSIPSTPPPTAIPRKRVDRATPGASPSPATSSPIPFEVDADRLLDIFSPFKEGPSGSQVDDFSAFDRKLQQRNTKEEGPASVSDKSSVLGSSPGKSLRLTAKKLGRTAEQTSSGSSAQGGVGMPHADKMILSKYVSKRSGVSGAGQFPAEPVVIPALGIGVDTAMRHNLVVRGPTAVPFTDSAPNDGTSSPATSTSRTKQSLPGRGSIIGLGSLVNLSSDPGKLGSKSPSLRGPEAGGDGLSPLHTAVMGARGPGSAAGRRASMPGIGSISRASPSGTPVDVKKIMTGIGNKELQTKPKTTNLETEDDDIASEMEELKRDLQLRHQLLRSQNQPAEKKVAASPKHATTNANTSRSNQSATTNNKTRVNQDADSQSVSTSETIDMATVRDLSTMLQNIKRETIVNMTGAWKK